MAEDSKTNFDRINDFLKTIIWPLIIVLVLILYGKQIGRLVKVIPDKVEQSSKMSFGSFSLEIDRAAKTIGNPELANIIKGLSEEAVKKLLELGTKRPSGIISYSIDKNGNPQKFSLYDINEYIELNNNGFLKIDYGSLSLPDWYSFFQSLGPKDQLLLQLKDGSYLYDFELQRKFNADTLRRKIIYKVLDRKGIAADDIEKLQRFQVSLSSKGWDAYYIILRAIGQQFNSLNENLKEQNIIDK